MDFEDTPQEAAFRARARAWLAANAPAFTPPEGISDAGLVTLLKAWHRLKVEAGFEAFHVPEAYGGKPGTPIETVIFKREEAHYPVAQVTAPYMTIGVGNGIPVMLEHASEAVRQQLIPPTVLGDLLWCQLFSEPGAGSDIAGIRTKSERDGDDWVINGQKVWSSGAHVADWALLLTRSDPTRAKHKGLTYFLLDMKSPGVEVRPLKQSSGRSEFNEVFFTDVRIPDAYRVGDVNGGWQVVLTTLKNERMGALQGGGASFGGDILEPLVRLARKVPGQNGEGRALDDADVGGRIADYYVVRAGIDHYASRLTTTVSRGGEPGPESGLGKVLLTRWLQEMAAFGMDLGGPAGALAPGMEAEYAALHDSYLASVGYRQGGGTEDINKSILAERALGLPADPRVDKDVPFDQSPGAG